MKPASLAVAAAIACLFPATYADAQHRHDRHGPPYRHGYYWYAPYPRWYYDPFWYAAPPFAYRYYAPPPRVVVEPVYEPRYYYAPAPERVERYPDRTYAQAEPAKPAPRLERYTLSARELFDFDKATLRLPQPKLDEIAEAMKRDRRIESVTITGYTDRLGSQEYNLLLSQRRAAAVKSYLVGKGVERDRLNAVGKGEANPVVQCDDKDRAALIRCLEPNRRVEVEQITVERPAR